ncbi:hypothetical protein WJX73_004069 [Symbiochloris irregularis]|uniref:FAD-binding PCMH-type domain-containing protein n=1 Tax=Symbiochloris irregularis TaxID=706552 RepID=A0AAW1P2V7_9CHLO
MAIQKHPFCYVNGKRHILPENGGDVSLLQFLRGVGHKGVKHGCGEAVCGACTVCASFVSHGKIQHRALNACIVPIYAVDGMHIITAEGIGNTKKGLHPIQACLATANGSQCGFCSPGFVMAIYAKLRATGGALSEAELLETLSGNLCRCTGYRPIVDAFRKFLHKEDGHTANGATGHEPGTEDVPAKAYSIDALKHAGLPQGGGKSAGSAESDTTTSSDDNICPSTGLPCSCKRSESSESENDGRSLLDDGRMVHAEPIFPPELRTWSPSDLCMPGRTTWLRPVKLAGLLELLQRHPDARLVGGSNELSIAHKYGAAAPKTLIAISHIPELTEMQVTEEGVKVGPAVTYTDLRAFCQTLIQKMPEHRTRLLAALCERISHFGGNQLCNSATIGGNVVTASSISDINALLMAAGATYTVMADGSKTRTMRPEDLITGNRKTSLGPNEVLTAIFIPFTREHEFVGGYKQSHKWGFQPEQLAVGNAAFCLSVEPTQSSGWKIKEARVALGGAVPHTQRAPQAEKALLNQPWTQDTLTTTLESLSKDVKAASPSSDWRATMQQTAMASFFSRFFRQVTQQLDKAVPGSADLFPATEKTGAEGLPSRGLCCSMQHYPLPEDDKAVVGQPHVHMAAHVQVTGEALYTGDVKLAGMLHGAVVTSPHAHAYITSLDIAAAEKAEGVRGIYYAWRPDGDSSPDDSSELGPHTLDFDNKAGHMVQDEEVLASKEVQTVGQAVVLVIADSERQAKAAARLVKVDYEPLDSLVSAEEAVAAGSFLDEKESTVIQRGDTSSAWDQEGLRIREGTISQGAQEQFYLEPHAAVVEPGEDDEFVVHASTQGPSSTQQDVARSLRVPAHKVNVHVKRVGGGFGGKEGRFNGLVCGIAAAARKLEAPVRLALDRHEDMLITGHRHPFLCKYKVGFFEDGRVHALEMQHYLNGGWSMDISPLVLGKALLHADNVYRIPHVRFGGRLCRTHTASNTAMRGLGGPQAMVACEMLMDRVAVECGLQQEAVRQLNMYQEGDTAPCGQPLEVDRIHECWEKVQQQADFVNRRQAVLQYNKQNRWTKQGIIVIPTKFGIGFTGVMMNQAGANVLVYMDGTVLISHGGVELGQGLHTKCAMVAAQELQIPLERIHIRETATDKVPNSSPTAASASSDLYCGAVMDACRQLSKRLAPLRKPQEKDGKEHTPAWEEVCKTAWFQRIDLSAHGFHATSGLTGMPGKAPLKYYVYGAAVTLVELDCLTGNFGVLRTDIVMDVGHSLNPALDIGQIEGAFVQGFGMTCCEELVWGDANHDWIPRGWLQTQGPGAYRLPTAADIPLQLRVTLLDPKSGKQGSVRPQNLIHSSKNVGEPPLFLGCSVYYAVKQAIYAAREASGLQGWFQLDTPLSPERSADQSACSRQKGAV